MAGDVTGSVDAKARQSERLSQVVIFFLTMEKYGLLFYRKAYSAKIRC